ALDPDVRVELLVPGESTEVVHQ
ncbi:MAG: hypothetical protein QOG10_2771, partial [Kribbellaceae bacterium]|nr:hypothetical protein [Kribbellaceae bacterium]